MNHHLSTRATIVFIVALLNLPALANAVPRAGSGSLTRGKLLTEVRGGAPVRIVLDQSDWRWIDKRSLAELKAIARKSVRSITGRKHHRQPLVIRVSIDDRSSQGDRNRIALKLLIVRRKDARMIAQVSAAASATGISISEAHGEAATHALRSAMSQLPAVLR